MTETRNIVVLGAGFGGLSAAHYYMKHIHPRLHRKNAPSNYRLILVDQSTHFWWHIAAPREIASPKLMPHERTFVPIARGFEQYRGHKDIIQIHQAQPVAVDTDRRTVTIKSVTPFSTANEAPNGETNPSHTETISYYALVIATGTRTPTSATSLYGDHTQSIQALDDLNKRLTTAKSIVIAGGGPVGVETAGEIGEALNGASGLRKSEAPRKTANIILVAGSYKLLPALRKSYAQKAERFLTRVSVDVLYNSKVKQIDMSSDPDGKTIIRLDDGGSLTADVYIPAMGVVPNSAFLPKKLLNEKGYVKTNTATLRVDDAGPRVYCMGDVGDHTHGGVLEIFNAMPIFGANMSVDLCDAPSTQNRTQGSSNLEPRPIAKEFKPDMSETQLVPVGRKKGVGSFKGMGLPSVAVYWIKGKDYMTRNMKDVTHGNKWSKV